MRKREVLVGLSVFVLASASLTLFVASLVAVEDARDIEARRALALTDTVSTERVPVLCYHYLSGDNSPAQVARVFGAVVLSLPILPDDDEWTVTRRNFRSQLSYLYGRGYQTVTLQDVDAWQRGEKQLPSRPIVITFDDGERSVYDIAFPMLKEFGFTATLFVTTGQMERQWNGRDMLTWPQIREMAESGVFAVESHTENLHYKVDVAGDMVPVFLAASRGAVPLGVTWQEGLSADLATSITRIAAIGATSKFLAWPYGAGSTLVDSVATHVGFQRMVAMNDLTNVRLTSGNPMSPINRYAVTARTSLRTFCEMLDGTHDAKNPVVAIY